MELALLAEGFHEMLMKVFGDNIHKALLADRCESQSWELPSLTVLWHCRSRANQSWGASTLVETAAAHGSPRMLLPCHPLVAAYGTYLHTVCV